MIVIKTRSIRLLMEERGFKTQRELSEASGIQYQHLNRILRGHLPKGMRMETLDRLCFALGCQPGDVLERVSK